MRIPSHHIHLSSKEIAERKASLETRHCSMVYKWGMPNRYLFRVAVLVSKSQGVEHRHNGWHVKDAQCVYVYKAHRDEDDLLRRKRFHGMPNAPHRLQFSKLYLAYVLYITNHKTMIGKWNSNCNYLAYSFPADKKNLQTHNFIILCV